MKEYKVQFTVNGKINPHGICVSADSISSVIKYVDKVLHNVYDGFDLEFEVVSISLSKLS